MINDMNQFSSLSWPKGVRTFKTKCIKLSRAVVEYLKQDQIFLNEYWRGGEDNGIRFPKLEGMVNELIQSWGRVFIKLNWRAPLDKQLSYDNLYDIFLSLKTSGVIMELISDYDELINTTQNDDDEIVLESTAGYILEIRKYYDLNPLNEYRVFIRNRQMIAISQKNLYLISDADPESIKIKLEAYFDTIKDQFNHANYIIDVYIDIAPNFNIILVDVNPWQEHTRSKLFTYEELETLNSLTIRLVNNKDEIIQESFGEYGVCEDLKNVDSFKQVIEMMENGSIV